MSEMREGTPEWALAYMEDAARHTLLDEGSGTKELRKAVKIITTALAEAEARKRRQGLEWQPIETAPRDGSRFWGRVDDDAIAMLWHEGFQAYVSSWRRMQMAAGYTINGADHEDHSPVTHEPDGWMPMPGATAPAETQKPEETA